MDADTARAYIELRLQPDVDPELTAAEVDGLLAMAATTDADGIAPNADGWTPTYDVIGCYQAITEGCAIKYAKAAGRVEFTTDGQTFRRQQLLDHLEHIRARWAAKVAQTTNLGSVAAE